MPRLLDSQLDTHRPLPWALLPSLALLSLASILAWSPNAKADGGGADRHVLEVDLGGGLSWTVDDPQDLDLRLGGQLNARLMVDLEYVRADFSATLLDPSRPELFSLRGDARLLFIVAHDFTYRQTSQGELIRVFGGLGGELDLFGDIGQLMLSGGFAMVRFQRPDDVLSETYGAYVGATLRLHFWEIRDELRVAVHGMSAPPEISLSFNMDDFLGGITAGVTVSNRLYLQVLTEDFVSLGPVLDIRFEELLEGPLLMATLGLRGTLGL